MIFALMAAALAAPNVVVVWYRGCSDLFPCNGTSATATVTDSHSSQSPAFGPLGNATSLDDISDFFAVSFSVTACGGLALVGLFATRRKAEHGGE